MMLYVFHVDVGRMMSFDMTVALSSVENLKDTIERLHGIPAANIVLLVSGGEMLTQSTQVSYYSAGTDTNPIYMFLSGDAKVPNALLQQMEADIDLREQVERCLELPAVYETVVTRAKLALQMHELARDEERLCERLVHEQHLQQQGWSAVVANMEDLTEEFRQRFRNFYIAFDRHLEKRNNYLELLRNFGDDLTKLARIPILPGLMPLAEADFHGFDEILDTDEVFSRSHLQQESVLVAPTVPTDDQSSQTSNETLSESINANNEEKSSTSPNKKLKMGHETVDEGESIVSTSQTSTTSSTRLHNLNLLQWITSKENHNTLKMMSDECIQGLETFSLEVYEKLKSEVQNIIKLAEQGDVKEIRGLGERLCKLEEFKYKIKNMVQDQKELSTAFQQNQNRAINLRDPSILPDLCASHQSQLVVMSQNHQKIRDHRRCIAKAKDELGVNLHTRLKRIVWIENAMSEFDNRLLFYHRCLRRAERHINIIEQIHRAPNIYVSAVSEVVRRKIFSGEFRRWASTLAGDFDTLHSEEIKRRQIFNASFEGHFLNILFPGMNDMPPAFANENPLVFDARLPNITKSDIDMLSSQVPDLASQIQLPDMGPVINFFVSRSGTHQKERMEELLRQQVAATLNFNATGILTMADRLPQPLRLSELQKEAAAVGPTGGCDESETDTETEFEKVPSSVPTTAVATSTSENQDPETIARSTITEQLLMQSAETLTDETESSIRAEVARLRDILGAMSNLSGECIQLARANLESVKLEAQMHREDLVSELQELTDKWNVVRMKCDAREKELQERSAQFDQELDLVRERLHQRDSECDVLKQQVIESEHMQEKCLTMEAQLEELRSHLKEAEDVKQRAVSKAREELIHEHKTEIESLRCRFKLMTSMERSPSDSSLEKLERPASSEDNNVIELAQHDALVTQLRADFEAEKQKEINAAIEVERSIWQSKIFPMNSESVMANVCLLKEMLEDKERQLDLMREASLVLTKENYQLKTRLDALTNEEGNSWLKEKIEYLNRDKSRLEEELTVEKTRRIEMESSVAALRCSTYEQGIMLRSKSSSSNHKYIVLDSCGKGDIVFVVWNMRHGQFVVVQDSPSLYFVHGDSLAPLNLRLPVLGDNTLTDKLPFPMPYYAVGRVIEKEYCQAKKDDNRYRVTRGSKFYRIKLAPILTRQASRRERLESFSSSISRSISQCESHSDSSNTSTSTLTGGSSGCSLRQSQSMSNTSPAMKDVTDGATVASPIITAQESSSSCKERTISITSVTEEDDEPLSLLGERCRYISVSEEDEPLAVAALAATGTLMPTTTLEESVITEQPTASNKLKLDLLLASADITQPQQETTPSTTINTTVSTSNAIKTDKTNVTPSTTALAVVGATLSTSTLFLSIEGAETNSPTIPTSVGTTSEDSDEYRSLEAKDEAEAEAETDFPLPTSE